MEANKRNLLNLKDEINDEEILNMYQPYQNMICVMFRQNIDLL